MTTRLTAWLDARRQRREQAILDACAGRALPSLEIAKAVGRPSGTLHPDLARLERIGALRSWWDDGPTPRRRLYQAPMGRSGR